MPEDRKEELATKMDYINTMMVNTTKHLTNPKNLAEVQSRIFNVLKPVEDALNNCVIHASNVTELHYCLDAGSKGLDDKLPRIREVLREY